MLYNGREFTKRDVLRYLGNISKAAGVRTSKIDGGKADGIRIHQVRAGDIEFVVMESRGMDLLELSYKGIVLNFLSKCGLVNTGLAEKEEMNFLHSVTGGMMYTCGISNCGKPYKTENGEEHFHGRMRFEPASNVCISQEWDENDYRISVSGEMREASLFGSNVVLKRMIETVVGENAVTITDEFENESYVTNPFMLMYHINHGFPIVQEGTKIFIPSESHIDNNEAAQSEHNDRRFISEPKDNGTEYVQVHNMRHDENGKCHAALFSETEQLGIGISFTADTLPMLLEWRSMASGDYAIGLQPTNCHSRGQEYELQNGTLKYIEPFQKIRTQIRLQILDGSEQFKLFERNINRCTIC